MAHFLFQCAIGISLCVGLIPVKSLAQNQPELADAAVRLKQAHVLRYYENCVKQKRSDRTCRIELEDLHPRELAALQKIFKIRNGYNELEVSKASAACYSPTNDYKDLIECWERLAAKMMAGEDIKLVAPKLVASLSETASAFLSELTPLERRSVVLCVRGKVSINYRDTVAHNLRIGGKDALWAMKINAFENAQMSKLAEIASWLEFKKYYDIETENSTQFIRGKIDINEYMLASQANQRILKDALTPEMSKQAVHGSNFEKYSDKCEKLSTILIGRAKLLASE